MFGVFPSYFLICILKLPQMCLHLFRQNRKDNNPISLLRFYHCSGSLNYSDTICIHNRNKRKVIDDIYVVPGCFFFSGPIKVQAL